MKPLVLLRTSTEDQTPELQLKDIMTMIPGIKPQVLIEQRSAWKENVKRPIMDQLISLIQQSKVSDLYVWDLDRIHRSRKRLTQFLVLCKNKSVKVHSYNQNWLESINEIPSPFNEIVNDLLISIMGWLSEEESTKKSNRVKMAVVRSNGVTLSAYGKRWGRQPVSEQTIKRVKELKSQGKSVRQIAEELTVYDKNRNERKLSKSAVHKLLRQIA